MQSSYYKILWHQIIDNRIATKRKKPSNLATIARTQNEMQNISQSRKAITMANKKTNANKSAIETINAILEDWPKRANGTKLEAGSGCLGHILSTLGAEKSIIEQCAKNPMLYSANEALIKGFLNGKPTKEKAISKAELARQLAEAQAALAKLKA